MNITKTSVSGPAACLLSTPKELQAAFLGCLGWATDVYIGAAWARPGWPIEELAARGVRVHAVVGLSFDMTVPDAIESLNGLGGDTWVRESTGPLFHPKLYLFRGEGRVEAIVGSANLTNAAFLSNSECGVRLALSKQEQRRWMSPWEGWRDEATRVTDRWLEQYRRTWRPPAQGPMKQMAEEEDLVGRRTVVNAPRVSSPEVLAASWPVYEAMLLRAAKRGEQNWLADDQKGYRAAIRELRPVAAGDLPPSGSREYRMLVGDKLADTAVDHGWLGHITGSGKAISKLGKHPLLRKELNAHLRGLRLTSMDDALANEQAARRVWERVCEEDGLSHGVATRLLALNRPERFFSVNARSVRGLAGALDVSMSSLQSWEGYSASLRRLWDSPWFKSPPPANRLSRELWDARVAIIDALVYQHKK